ncbi:allophanate hydrolase [Methylomonas methanica]|uniref:Allophanate hydrolase n=1 Tax=Methylomonas methanica TaxID=421 RepID=A0A177LWC0_METMH|nr:allophanate hydrolase [Methylomonas methanica]OAH97765.1 allophanate hydrolase [Methylomonas methanica]
MKTWSELPKVLSIADLSHAYRNGLLTPAALVNMLWQRLESAPERGVWISRLPLERLLTYAKALADQSPDELPLYGIPFAIKDNIDLADLPTTAACPAYAYQPQQSAFVVRQLIAAGAIPVGKTNLDQFATGLVGTRSPYGVCQNSFDPAYIAGGSSSGSAVTVATGLASFALGTDTAGSGRVPAAFNNLVGIKPTRGLLSTAGVVPACRSLDCVSVFALTAADAQQVLQVAVVYDDADAYNRPDQPLPVPPGFAGRFRCGVPKPEQLQFFGDDAAESLFAEAVAQMQAQGGSMVEVDIQPLLEAAALLYAGPWLAERYLVAGELMQTNNPDALFPVTRDILAKASDLSAADAWRAFYRLQDLKRQSEAIWQQVDVLVTPTTGTIYPIAAVEASPVELNSRLGYYTNFMNLLDLSAIALPAGFRTNGLPFGITLCAPAFADRALLALAKRREQLNPHSLGISQISSSDFAVNATEDEFGFVRVAVCGAHMSGLPLNHLLTGRGGIFLQSTFTAPTYRLYALPDGKRPGMVRDETGASISVEVWALPISRYGEFVAEIPPPLGIGSVLLHDGSTVQGFVCEAAAVREALDITGFGGWRAYLTRPD